MRTLRPGMRRSIAGALLLLLPLLASADVLAGGVALVGLLHGDHRVTLRSDAAHFDLVMLHGPGPPERRDVGTSWACGQDHAHGTGDAPASSSKDDHRVHLFAKGLGGARIATTHAAPSAPALGPATPLAIGSEPGVRVPEAGRAMHFGLIATAEGLRTVVLRA